jgi:ABC-type glycerol-3-phosphate transport system permease component
MINIVAGVVPMILMIVFLGFLAFYAKSIPLVVIMLPIVGMMLYDFVDTIRKEKNDND